MSKPSVLFATHSAFVSGAEYMLLNMTKHISGANAFLFEDGPLNPALARQGVKVHVSRWARGFSRFKRDRSLLLAFPLMFRLLMTVAELGHQCRQVDCVYANSQKAFTLAALAKLIGRRPLIWHLHDILDLSHFGKAQLRFQTALANHFADKVIVPSEAAAHAFIAQGGRRDRVVVVANGTDPAPSFSYVKEDLLRELGISDAPIIGVFSRLAFWKGQHVVLQALKAMPEVHCVLVGDALFGEEDYRNNLLQLTEELGLSERVHFLGQRNDVRQLMSVIDTLVHPSVSPEPFGLTLIEAMSVGTPIVATAIGASEEILEDGKAGILVPADNPEAIATAVVSVLQDRPHAQKMGEYARSRFTALYTADKMRSEIHRVVHELGKPG